MSTISFSREKTQILKGLALLLMLVHHTCTPSYWAEEGTTTFARYQHLQSETKMCVYIFAFLVGYGLFCSKNKTMRYSLKRILLLVIPFWTMLFFMFIPASVASGKFVDVFGKDLGAGCLEIIYNMFGISESLNWYSWFVCFYILTILSMPFLHRLFERFPKWGWITGFYIAECAIHFIPGWDTNHLLHNLFIYTSEIPLVIVGYMCGCWNQEGKIPAWFEGKSRIPLALLAIIVVMLIKSINIPTMGFCLQAFYTPILIFAIVGIFNSVNLKWLGKGLQNIGDQSMYMWFFHAIFFTTTVNLYTKALVFEPFNCFLWTLLMTFILTYIGSWIIRKILTPLINRIK